VLYYYLLINQSFTVIPVIINFSIKKRGLVRGESNRKRGKGSIKRQEEDKDERKRQIRRTGREEVRSKTW
jgi:hypothetical protein